MRGYGLWLCAWWRSAGPRRKSVTRSPPASPQPRWRYGPPQRTRSETTSIDVRYQCLMWLTYLNTHTHTHTSYELKQMLPRCRIEDRMAQRVEIWSAWRPIVSKHWIKSWKSCLSCFPFNSHTPPYRWREKKTETWKTWWKPEFRRVLCLLMCDVLGLGSNRSRLPAGRAPVCPSHSYLPAAHRIRGSSSPHWPTNEITWTRQWHVDGSSQSSRWNY